MYISIEEYPLTDDLYADLSLEVDVVPAVTADRSSWASDVDYLGAPAYIDDVQVTVDAVYTLDGPAALAPLELAAAATYVTQTIDHDDLLEALEE